MSTSEITVEILNHLGGLNYVNRLMCPSMLMGGNNSLGIRLKRQNKNKINHIEILKESDDEFNISFWVLPKDIMKEQKKIAFFLNVKGSEIKKIIESQTNFLFARGDMDVNKKIAMNILDQLGGLNIINAMLGIERVVPVENGVSLTFKVGAAKNINTFEVLLDPTDTYTVNFYQVTTSKRDLVSSSSNIYCDMLKKWVEDELQCSLTMPKFI